MYGSLESIQQIVLEACYETSGAVHGHTDKPTYKHVLPHSHFWPAYLRPQRLFNQIACRSRGAVAPPCLPIPYHPDQYDSNL